MTQEEITQLATEIAQLRQALATVGKTVKGMIEKPAWYDQKDLHRLVKIIGDALAR